MEYNPFDIVLANMRTDLILSDGDSDEQGSQVGISWINVRGGSNYPIYQADLVDEARPGNHDTAKLLKIILDLYREKTGPLVQ